jgi:hypothetical protein
VPPDVAVVEVNEVTGLVVIVGKLKVEKEACKP